MISTICRRRWVRRSAASRKLPQKSKQKADTHERATIIQTLDEFSTFAAEFAEFVDASDVDVSTAAQVSIGRVQYSFTIEAGHGCYPNMVNKMNIVVKDLQETGDAILKLLVISSLVAYGPETPIPWLPSLQRAAVRAAIQERAERLVEKEEIATPWSPGQLEILTLEVIREFWDQVSHTPNKREVQYIAKNLHPLYEGDLDLDNEVSAQDIMDTFKFRFQKLIPIEVLKTLKIPTIKRDMKRRVLRPIARYGGRKQRMGTLLNDGTDPAMTPILGVKD